MGVLTIECHHPPHQRLALDGAGRKCFYMTCAARFPSQLAAPMLLINLLRVLQGMGGGCGMPSEQAILT